MAITKEQVMNATGSELNELVALAAAAHGWEKIHNDTFIDENNIGIRVKDYSPSTNLTQCIEIMQSVCMGVFFLGNWVALMIHEYEPINKATGDTLPIAVCRCFVLSELEALNGS